jgi:predicted choloylglycine hydrolase
MLKYLFKGNAKEIGCQHGKLITNYYHEALHALYNSEYWKSTKKSLFNKIKKIITNLKLLNQIKKEIQNRKIFTPYMNGIKNAPGIKAMQLNVILLNEIIAGDRRGNVGAAFGCSGIAQKVNNRGYIIGKNFDFQYPLTPYQVMIVKNQTDFYSYASFSPLFMVLGGQLCINNKGLVVSYNYCYSRHGFSYKGVPLSFIVHHILSTCENCEEALHLLKKANFFVNNGGSLLIAGKDDASIVEMWSNHIDFYTQDMQLINTNHFQTPIMKKLNFPDDSIFTINHPEIKGKKANESSFTRLIKIKKVYNKLNTIENIIDILGEETNDEGMNNIFQTSKFWGTISSFVVIPGELKVIYYKDIRNKQGEKINLTEYFNN